MGRIFAAVYDRMSTVTEEAGVREWRRQLIADLAGDVLELGAGTGLNLDHYTEAVSRLVLTEPDRHMRAKLEARIAETRPAPGGVEVVDAGAERLPFPDDSFDAVVSTFVLCSVPDHRVALTEVRRVLRPGGRLVYLEHVAADQRPKRLRWQRRVEPLWRRVFGGCHLTRRTLDDIAAAGFDVDGHVRESIRKAHPMVRTSERGIARS